MPLKEKISRWPVIAIALALLLAPAVFAHNRAPAIDLAPSIERYEIPAREHDDRSLTIIDAASRHHFERVSTIELSSVSIADRLENRLSAITALDGRASLSVFTAKKKLASRLLALREKGNVNDASELARKVWWGGGFKAAPFVEPATGLVYFRNRWYDPAVGTWLTPDAHSYSAGSSNLYAGFNLDPVNNSDPDGREPITGAAVLAYLGWVAINTGVDVGIDYAFNEIGDWWNGTETEFDWHKSLTTNFAVDLATGGIGGKAAKLRYLAKLRNPVTRKVAAEGIEYAADVAVTGSIYVALNDQGAGGAFGSAAIGGAGGRTLAYGLRHGRGILGRLGRYRGGRGEFLEDVNEALARRRGEDVFVTQRRNRTGFDLGAHADGTAFLDEVKFYNGTVRHSDVTSAGLHFAEGQSATRALRRNLTTAIAGARAGDLNVAAELLKQRNFTLRLVGGPATRFDPYIGEVLSQRGISHTFNRISRRDIFSYIWFGY